jgi:O-Antigen ligase
VAFGVAAAGVATGLAMALALQAAGPKGALVPALAGVALLFLRFPALSLALLVAGAVVVEATTPGLLPPVESFYDVAEASLTPQDILLLAGFGGVLFAFAIESRRPRLPEPFIAPLALLGLAVAAGVVTGYTSQAHVPIGELFHRSMTAFYLILVPLLAVNVLRDTRALRIFAFAVAVLATYKAGSGLYAALAGVGASIEDETISYLNPVPNFVMLLFVLGVAAAMVRRVELPVWMYGAAPLALLALVLSYRRSFWIAAAFSLLVVVVLASRKRGRAVFALAAVAAAVTLGATMLVGSSDPSANPLAERVQTLSPSGLGSNRGDRYRIDERRNVIESIKQSPLTGNGLGVPWSVHYPLAEAHDRRYVHVATLWYWHSFGPLGTFAYLLLFGTALWAASLVWRRHPDPYVQVGAVASLGGILALLVVELTATFSGVEPRFSVVIGALLGWLAAAWHDLPKEEDAPRSRPA